MRKALFITIVSTTFLIIAAQLVLAFCCRLPIASKDLSEYTFIDPLPLSVVKNPGTAERFAYRRIRLISGFILSSGSGVLQAPFFECPPFDFFSLQ